MEIIGNEDILKKLEKISKLDKVPPLLFYGQFGIGKATTALYFCAMSNPENQRERILKLSHPDIIILTNGELKPYGPRPDNFDNLKNISIEQVRSLKIELQKPPIYAKRRFVIIMDADMLTMEAQNALLKILEEYESRTTFILITSNYSRILPTILSRTLKISFKSLTFEQFKHYRYDWKHNIDELYKISEGSIGVAKALNDYENLKNWITTMENVLIEHKVSSISDILDDVKTSVDFLNFLRVYRYFFKNKYQSEGSDLYYRALRRSLEVEDFVRRYASIEGAIISLFEFFIY